MNRQQFLSTLGAIGIGTILPTLRAVAADPPGAFKKLSAPAPTDVPAGKIEVVEFFWFGCPHCASLEPVIEKWAAALPADVVFRRQHVPFREKRHQQLYFTLQAMQMDTPKVLARVFAAIHTDRKRMLDPKEILDVLAPLGVDAKAFNDAWASFGVRTKMQRADKLADAYAIDGVPALGVNGKYLTAPSMAGSNEAALEVVNRLVAQERGAAR
ncbi:MAG: thiol:disulfide interchange protein DsbA/DsbL [Lautropia sp.]